MLKAVDKNVTVTAPRMAIVQIPIQHLEPLVIARFNKKAELMEKMAEGQSAKNKKERKAREYEKEAEESKHISECGWEGICASAFRSACISACRLVGYKMTVAKLSIFFLADGYDAKEGTPLVRIYGDKAITYTSHVRNATGVVDIRSRPMYKKWGALLNVRYDQDQFSADDVVNLIARVGLQVGIGEGRPDSKNSAGLGFGLFEIVSGKEEAQFLKKYGIKKLTIRRGLPWTGTARHGEA